MALTDRNGRDQTYLRLSLTDKCNLRCRYCTPSCGVERLKHEDILTLEETIRLSSILTRKGVKKIRLTGGEPLLRKNIIYLISSLADLPERPELALTTNGILLDDMLDDLRSAGLNSVNISLDTLIDDVYENITGQKGADIVIRTVYNAVSKGFKVKLNVVPLLGINDDSLTELAELARNNDISVRFIELMPIGCATDLEGISNDIIRDRLSDRYGAPDILEQEPDSMGPAHYVRYHGFTGTVGFIDPISHRFCSNCNRLRLSSDGKLRLCLDSKEAIDLKTPMRQGASDDELAGIIIRAVYEKPSGHLFDNKDRQTNDNMIGIGG